MGGGRGSKSEGRKFKAEDVSRSLPPPVKKALVLPKCEIHQECLQCKGLIGHPNACSRAGQALARRVEKQVERPKRQNKQEAWGSKMHKRAVGPEAQDERTLTDGEDEDNEEEGRPAVDLLFTIEVQRSSSAMGGEQDMFKSVSLGTERRKKEMRRAIQRARRKKRAEAISDSKADFVPSPPPLPHPSPTAYQISSQVVDWKSLEWRNFRAGLNRAISDAQASPVRTCNRPKQRCNTLVTVQLIRLAIVSVVL